MWSWAAIAVAGPYAVQPYVVDDGSGTQATAEWIGGGGEVWLDEINIGGVKVGDP